MSETGEQKIIILARATTDLEDYRRFAQTAARLKPFGRVCVSVGGLATKARHDFPPGGSPWHEYAAFQRALHRVFPHPKIAPHVPAEWVARNRELVVARSKILDEFGLGASYESCDPFFLPESFYEEYPQLRGPRVDHAARSRAPAFAWCVDRPEVLEMMAWMVGELKKNVPGLLVYRFLTNDSGSGFCWSDYLYTGSNGPVECQLRPMNERMRGFFQAIHDGATNNGGDIHVMCHNNVSRTEHDMLKPIRPPQTHLGAKFRSDPEATSTGNLGGHPARGLFDPLAIIESVERFRRPGICFLSVSLGVAHYPLQAELPLASERIVDVVEDCLREPTSGYFSRAAKLRKLAERWGGAEAADALTDAFASLHQAFGQARKHSTVHEAVNTRYMTRPLVVKPELLTSEEEDYFLPHVFNVSREDARQDYVNIHGTRKNTVVAGDWLYDGALRGALAGLVGAAKKFETLEGAPEAEFLRQFALGLRIYASAVRSCTNFFYGQVFRDRNREALSAAPEVPPPQRRIGLGGYAQWAEIARDELENVEELIGVLERGGRDVIVTARAREDEDTFTLGPNIIEDLKKKRAAMLRHWADVQQ
jgi:hypothetical protein